MTPADQPSRSRTARLTVLVVGATSGLGRAVATQLAESGHRVLAVGRDPRKVTTLRTDLARANPDGGAAVLAVDVAVRAGWDTLAGWAHTTTKALDAVIFNAGIMLPERTLTADGLEEQFAIHHLAPYALTARLWPLLMGGHVPGGPRRAAAAHQADLGLPRIVNVNSAGHRTTLGGHIEPTLDFNDLQAARAYDPFLVYGRTKLANLLFTYELARRHGDQIAVNALHPGVVRSDLGRAFPRWRARLAQATGTSPAKAAPAVIRLATAVDLHTNGAYYDRDRLTRSSGPSYDAAAAVRLWQVSEQIAGPLPAVDPSLAA